MKSDKIDVSNFGQSYMQTNICNFLMHSEGHTYTLYSVMGYYLLLAFQSSPWPQASAPPLHLKKIVCATIKIELFDFFGYVHVLLLTTSYVIFTKPLRFHIFTNP